MSVIYIMSNTAYNDKNGDSEEPFNFQPKVTFHDIEDSEATDANDRLQEFIRNKLDNLDNGTISQLDGYRQD